MGIVVREAEDADMVQLFTIASRAFARNEPFFDATFPEHWTEQGRLAGGKRFLQLRQEDPSVHYYKAVDTDTGAITGFARWVIYADHVPEFPSSDLGPHWNEPEEKDYFHLLLLDFLKPRYGYVAKAGGNVVSLDICAVDPDHQRKGVGGHLVSWGTDKADQLGVDAVVESSIYGRGLYEKHGFVFERDVEISAKGRASMKFAWLTRPKRTGA